MTKESILRIATCTLAASRMATVDAGNPQPGLIGGILDGLLGIAARDISFKSCTFAEGSALRIIMFNENNLCTSTRPKYTILIQENTFRTNAALKLYGSLPGGSVVNIRQNSFVNTDINAFFSAPPVISSIIVGDTSASHPTITICGADAGIRIEQNTLRISTPDATAKPYRAIDFRTDVNINGNLLGGVLAILLGGVGLVVRNNYIFTSEPASYSCRGLGYRYGFLHTFSNTQVRDSNTGTNTDFYWIQRANGDVEWRSTPHTLEDDLIVGVVNDLIKGKSAEVVGVIVRDPTGMAAFYSYNATPSYSGTLAGVSAPVASVEFCYDRRDYVLRCDEAGYLGGVVIGPGKLQATGPNGIHVSISTLLLNLLTNPKFFANFPVAAILTRAHIALPQIIKYNPPVRQGEFRPNGVDDTLFGVEACYMFLPAQASFTAAI